jgi:mannose-6-phosphate isomerase-like protein (cupin superfamily)
MRVRRVVTGHNPDGKAVFASDERLDALTLALAPGAEFYPLWGADQAATFPDDGSPPAQSSYFPPVGGYRFSIFTIPPQSMSAPVGLDDRDMQTALAEAEEKLPGLLAHAEPDSPGMHTTDTIDFEVVLSGEVILELDDGVETVLRPGDTVVQNGTRHRWGNRGTEPAVLALFITGAYRATRWPAA